MCAAPVKARDLEFGVSNGKEVREFISRNHYSRKCPPATHYFSASHNGTLYGAMTFRKPSLPKIASGYNADLELSRLYMIDEALRNSESRFIGWCLRWLSKNTDAKRIISYADPYYNHTGRIYAASNFRYFGKEKGHGTRVLIVNGERMQAKTAYDRWGASGKNLENIIDAQVDVIVMPQKHVWLRDVG